MWLQHLRCQLWIRTPLDLEVFLILKRPCVWGVFWAVQIKQLGSPGAWHPVRAPWGAQCLLLQSQGGVCVSSHTAEQSWEAPACACSWTQWEHSLQNLARSKSVLCKLLCYAPVLKEKIFFCFAGSFGFYKWVQGRYQTWGICCSNISALCSSQAQARS